MPAVAEASGGPRATLRARDVFALTLGIVIGAGIFRTPSLVAGVAADEVVLLLVWTAGGLLSIVGALCYAELASTYPDVGGIIISSAAPSGRGSRSSMPGRG